MTRFDADEPTERRKLFAEAVLAHRERGSRFCTVEADPVAAAEGAGAGGEGDDAGSEDDAGEGSQAPPWVQFGDETFNFDCTDAELDRLKAMLEEFPDFRIDQIESPEEAEGSNVRVTARSDANRLAGFVDRAFQDVYGLPEDYRAWVVRV